MTPEEMVADIERAFQADLDPGSVYPVEVDAPGKPINIHCYFSRAVTDPEEFWKRYSQPAGRTLAGAGSKRGYTKYSKLTFTVTDLDPAEFAKSCIPPMSEEEAKEEIESRRLIDIKVSVQGWAA